MGLRAQIVLSLLAVFVASFALLGLAALQLTQRGAEMERRRLSQVVAHGVARELEAGTVTDQRLSEILAGYHEVAPIAAARLSRPDGRIVRWGVEPEAPATEVASTAGDLALWLPPADPRARLPLGDLLLFYVGLTGVVVLVFAYLALTRLIVRPMDLLTRSSERLASGAVDVSVPVRGSAEVVRLARAFNAMATQLRAERTALEERLRELEHTAADLRATQKQLVHGEKLASVGRLAAGIAHEIGNPLSAILGLLELLREGDLTSDEEAEFLTRIQRETERINGTIRNLLDFSRPDDPRESEQSADIEQVVRDAIDLVRPQKEASNVAFEVQVEAGVGRVQGGPHRLTQVLLNLLLNAVDALEGRGHLWIRVAPDAEPHAVRVCVEDDGPGIPEELVDHLFEPFTTTKPVGQGTGLGLAVCHALVDGLGGRITARNLAQGGARFEVVLPALDVGDRGAT